MFGEQGGVRLLGLDVPTVVEEREGVLRVIAAVEHAGKDCVPIKLALLVRDVTAQRCAKVLKEMPLDGPFTIGLAVWPLTSVLREDSLTRGASTAAMSRISGDADDTEPKRAPSVRMLHLNRKPHGRFR
jgi:hypothetical protein